MHPSDRHEPPPSFLWSIWVVLVTIIVGLFLAWLSNKMMVEELVKRGTAKIYAPVLSLFYKDTGQQNITVITIDDADLKEYGLNWPVSLDYYQRVIDALTKRHAKAIFLDILFLDEKPEKELRALADAACRATDAGIPFFLATFARESLTSDSERKLFAARTPTGTPCVIPVQASVSPDALEQSQWSYPLQFSNHEAPKHEAPQSPASVALSIYCNLYKASCPEHAETPLALIWGSKSAPTNSDIMVDRDMTTGALAPVCRGHWNWWEIIPGASMLNSMITRSNMLPVCPYNQVVPVRALKGKGFSAEELNQAISGKIVLIGADLKAVGDNVFSPLQGRLPGVHVHAMALDNLITFNGQYKENGEFEWHEYWHSRANQFVILSITLIATAMVFWRRHKEKIIADTKLSDDLPNAPDLKGWTLVFTIIGMIPKIPSMILMGTPRGYSSPKEKQASLLQLVEVLIYIALGTLVLGIGYWLLDQGPLAIIEYVLFSLMAHFSHLGTLIAQRAKHVASALMSKNPELIWSKKQKEYNKKENH